MVMVMVKDAMVLWTQIELDPDLNDHQVGFQLPATEIEQVFTKKKLQSLEDALLVEIEQILSWIEKSTSIL